MKLKINIILVILLSTLFACTDGKEGNQNLLLKVDSLQIQNDSLKKILMEKDIEPEVLESPQWYYPETDSRALLENGIENPEEHIKDALRKRLDLIPMEAVLGGTMHYSNIQLLGDQWVIADFEDGHVYGKAILDYTVDNKNEVKFKLIALSEN